MRALDLGFTRLKFFPAVASGGVAALKALSSAFGQVRFCPTGGITPNTASDWLALEAVACVGGSWLVPGASAEKRGDFHASLQSSVTALKAIPGLERH